jgi:hypothetical protein
MEIQEIRQKNEMINPKFSGVATSGDEGRGGGECGTPSVSTMTYFFKKEDMYEGNGSRF